VPRWRDKVTRVGRRRRIWRCGWTIIATNQLSWLERLFASLGPMLHGRCCCTGGSSSSSSSSSSIPVWRRRGRRDCGWLLKLCRKYLVHAIRNWNVGSGIRRTRHAGWWWHPRTIHRNEILFQFHVFQMIVQNGSRFRARQFRLVQDGIAGTNGWTGCVQRHFAAAKDYETAIEPCLSLLSLVFAIQARKLSALERMSGCCCCCRLLSRRRQWLEVLLLWLLRMAFGLAVRVRCGMLNCMPRRQIVILLSIVMAGQTKRHHFKDNVCNENDKVNA
jgi:hypothetical protein